MGQAVERIAALDLLALAQQDPQRTIELTEHLPSSGPTTDDCVGLRARTVAFRVLGELAAASESIANALEIARTVQDQQLEATCLLTSAAIAAQLGDVDGAFELLNQAELVGEPLHRAEVQFQRAGITMMVADWQTAWHQYTAALSVFADHDQALWRAESLLGRGLTSAYMGHHDDAASDLDESVKLFDEVGDDIGVGQAIWNRALARLQQGEPALAVADFDRASVILRKQGFPLDLFLADQAAAMFALGLNDEAIEMATRCVDAHEVEADQNVGDAKVRNELDAASRRLELSRTLMQIGDLELAQHHCELAAERFTEQGQRTRALYAQVTLLDIEQRLDALEGRSTHRAQKRAQDLFGALAGGGQGEWQTEARLIAARAALADGNHDEARRELRQLGRSHRMYLQELERLTLLATLESKNDNDGAALRYARRAIRFVARSPRLAGTSYIEAAISRRIETVTEVGLSALLRAGRAADALAFAEAADLSRSEEPSTSPPTSMAQYRSLTRAIDEATNDLRDPTPIIARRQQVAQQIRADQTSLMASSSAPEPRSSASVIRWVVADGHVWLLERSGRVKAKRLASVDEVTQLVRELMFVLTRDLGISGGGDSDTLAEVAAELDQALGEPGKLCSKHLEHDGVVRLRPSAMLPSIAFGLLPSLHEVPWVRVAGTQQTRAQPDDGPVTLVAGPNLQHADGEVNALATIYPKATMITNAGSTTAAVLHAFEQSRLVHIAAHSSLNSNNVMFSSIDMVDGPLYLQEIQSLTTAPTTVVLASCESAKEQRVGTSAIGLASGLLRCGIHQVVGTALPIPDCEETVEVMVCLHDLLRTMHAADAVAQVRSNVSLSDRSRLIAASLVVCTAS